MDWTQLGVILGVAVTATTLLLNLGKVLSGLGTLWRRLREFAHGTTNHSTDIPSKTIVAIIEPRINSLWWTYASAGDVLMMQVVADFNVTNIWSKDVRLAGALLRYRRWVVMRRLVRGDTMVKDLSSVYSGNYPIPPNAMTRLRVTFIYPERSQPDVGHFSADVGIVDQFNNHHCIKRVRFNHVDKILS